MQHRGCGQGLQEAVGTQGARPPHGAECPDSSTDRWGWAGGAQVFQVGDPPTRGPGTWGPPAREKVSQMGLWRWLFTGNGVSSPCPRVGS